MPQIDLTLLNQHGGGVTPYPNNLLYVDAAPATTLDANTAQTAYGLRNWRYSEDRFADQMDELAEYVVNTIQPPSTFNGPPVFHVSAGTPSASIYFRIYGAPVGYAGGAAQAVSVININHQRGFIISISFDSGTRVDGINVNGMNLKFSYGGTNYQVIYEIVGIGNHEGEGYRLRLWNDPVFNGHLSGTNCITL